MAGPLTGIRVLDMTRVIAGPLAGQTLGDLGADVIKVERKGEGDESRRVGPPWMPEHEGIETPDSTYYQAVNRNKRSIAVDFATEAGADLVRRLADRCDVLLENYRPGTLDRYGLGANQLRQRNPGLIYCSLTGFGQTGPYSSRSGYDYLVQGMGGLMSVTGLADGEPGAGPIRVGIPVVDIFGGMNATIGILAALRHRDATGEGQNIDIALYDSQLAAMLNAASSWLNAGVHLGRTGNDHPSAVPYGIYEASDGYVIIATFNDREFVRLAEVLGRPDWKDDPRYKSMGARVANRAAIKAEVAAIVIRQPRAHWVKLLNEAKISTGPINEMSDVAADPQTLARDMVVTMEHPVIGPIRAMGSPLKLSASPPEYRMAPPLLGENTNDILRSVLGADEAEIAALSKAGAI